VFHQFVMRNSCEVDDEMNENLYIYTIPLVYEVSSNCKTVNDNNNTGK
jgi:hypothetical protein